MTVLRTVTAMASVAYRWDVDSFLRAQDAAAFRSRVELVDGQVWPVVLDDWHGDLTAHLVAVLSQRGQVSQATLATGESLPDPDLWLRRIGAQPVDVVSARLSRWDPADVLLVVEVADETVQEDLTIKARLYAAAGYARYWVVTHDGIHEHTAPTGEGYTHVRRATAGDSVDLPDGTVITIRELLP